MERKKSIKDRTREMNLLKGRTKIIENICATHQLSINGSVRELAKTNLNLTHFKHDILMATKFNKDLTTLSVILYPETTYKLEN